MPAYAAALLVPGQIIAVDRARDGARGCHQLCSDGSGQVLRQVKESTLLRKLALQRRYLELPQARCHRPIDVRLTIHLRSAGTQTRRRAP